jgi:hypothetical protein
MLLSWETPTLSLNVTSAEALGNKEGTSSEIIIECNTFDATGISGSLPLFFHLSLPRPLFADFQLSPEQSEKS